MAKGQKRKTREAKKPKQAKKADTGRAASPFSALHGNKPPSAPAKK